MACIHFKFKNSLDYDSITFDGLHIALRDLKRMIMNRKKLRDTDDDLQIINAITKKAYSNEDEMIPKNSSVIVARIPVTNAAPRNGPKTLNHPNAYKEDPKPVKKPVEVPVTKAQDPLETGNLIDSNASEEEKINAMMRQSTMDFDPSNYINNKKAPIGTPSPTYICKKCGKSGHFIQNCPVEPGEAFDKEKIAKRPTGIPHSFLTKVNDPNAQGALLIGPGQYGVPTIDMNAYQTKKKERPPFLPEEKLPEPKKEEIPAEILCPLCRDLLSDAVLIPCCGTSFCDDCIRNALLDSEDHECPQCHETEKSPDSLVANKSLRVAVTNYRNETGYTKVTKAMLKSQQEKAAVERAARKSEIKEKRTAPTNSRPYEKTAPAQAIPTYGMKAGQHYKVGGFQGGRSPGSPANASPKISDSQNSSDPSTVTKPSLLVSTTPGPVPGGLSPPTPCKDETNLLTPASSAQVSVQSTSTSGHPSLSASVTSQIPPRTPVIPANFPTAPIQTVGVPYRPPLPIVNPAIPPPGFVAPPPAGPFGAGPRFPPAPAVIPPFQAGPPPPLPLSKEEFYRRQKKLQEHEKKKKADPLDVFARELMDYKKKPKSASRSRSRSRSRTPRRSNTPRRSRTRSKSRSITPRKRSRSLTPRKRSRSLTPRKRSYTPRSRTRSRSRSLKRSRSPYGKPPYRSRSRTRSPRSRTPPRYRSRSRSFSPRYRSRSPRPRSYSRSPIRYRGRSPPPRWRSRSRSPGRYDRWSPPPYGRRRSRSPPPPLYRGRSRSPPPYDYYRQDWDAPPPMYGDYRGPPGRPGGRGPMPPHYQYPPDQFNRFDPHAYDEFYHEYYARYGMPPPPPPTNQMYDAPPYPPRRSRSPRDRRPFKERPQPRPRTDDSKPNRSDKKSVDKKTDKKSSKSSSKREEDKASKKKKTEKTSNKEKDVESKAEEKKENGEEKKEEVKDSQSRKKKKGSSKTSKKEPVESNVKGEKLKDKEEEGKPVKSDEEKDRKEDLKEKDTQEKVEKKEINDVENLDVKKEKLEDVKESKEEKVRSKKKSSGKKDNGEKLEALKSPKEEMKSPKEESSKEGERKAKRKHKKMGKESSTKEKKLVEEDEAEESPAKRQKTEPVAGDQIMLSPPILSKWEKEDYHDDVSPRRSRKASPDSKPSKQERKMLPRSVIEKAEKALALKQPQPISVASSIKPSSSLSNRLEKSPPPKLRSPEGKPRRVYMEKGSSKKVEEDSRKVLSRDRSMQITVSADVKSKTKSKDSKKEVKDLRESLLEKRRASNRSSSTEEWEQNKGKGFSHDDRLSVNYAREKDWDYIDDDKNTDGWLSNKVKGSSKSMKACKDIDEERRSASKEKVVEKGRKPREERESPKRPRKEENGEEKISNKNSRSQEKKEDRKRKDDIVSKRDSVEKATEKEESKEKEDVEKPGDRKQQMRMDRKESLFDESAFVPDYNETMGSESEEDVPKQELKRQYSTAESEKVESESEEESSGEEREKKHKKKKSKHKKNKKKHKKHKKKHKKQDGDESS